MSFEDTATDYIPRAAEIVMERWGQPVLDSLDSPSDYHRQMRMLREPVRHVIATELLLWQVNNGGFWQYFYNSYGIMIDDAIEGLKAIGQESYAAIAERAKLSFGVNFPEDRILRVAFVGDDEQNARIDFSSFDDEFYALDPDITGFAYDRLDAYAEAAKVI